MIGLSVFLLLAILQFIVTSGKAVGNPAGLRSIPGKRHILHAKYSNMASFTKECIDEPFIS